MKNIYFATLSRSSIIITVSFDKVKDKTGRSPQTNQSQARYSLPCIDKEAGQEGQLLINHGTTFWLGQARENLCLHGIII